MRKRKSLKKNDEDSDGSEGAAEPEEFQDSGEDWTPDADSVNYLSHCFVRKFSLQLCCVDCNYYGLNILP